MTICIIFRYGYIVTGCQDFCCSFRLHVAHNSYEKQLFDLESELDMSIGNCGLELRPTYHKGHKDQLDRDKCSGIWEFQPTTNYARRTIAKTFGYSLGDINKAQTNLNIGSGYISNNAFWSTTR